MRRLSVLCVAVVFLHIGQVESQAVEPTAPAISELVVKGSQKNLRFTPYPGANAYQFFSATNIAGPYAANTNFILTPYITGYSTNYTTNGGVTITNYAYEWRNTNFSGNSGFFKMSATPASSNAIVLANALNRLAYGPTPDDLLTYGNNPQAFIDEQLNMNGVPETMDDYFIEVTNSVPIDATTNWTFVTQTGTLAANAFYLFTTQPGTVMLDDMELWPHYYTNYLVTNIVNNVTNVVTNSAFSHIITTNLLQNGDFESGFAPWTSVGGASGSSIVPGGGRLGGSGLQVASTTGAASTGSDYIRQTIITSPFVTTNPCTLRYWYLPGDDSNKLRIQLGSGLNSTPGGIPPTPGWVYVKATGTANATGRIYFFMSGAGTCYLDDIKLVAGTNAGAGVNLLSNGDFEIGATNSWLLAARYATNTMVDSTTAHTGNYSLKLVGTSGGSAATTASMYQSVSLTAGQTYTLSYWYLPTTVGVNLTAQLDGGGLLSTPNVDAPGYYRQLSYGTARLSDYRAWFCQHAVVAKRQLFEVLSQFWENHFVTQHTKSRDYIDNNGYDAATADRIATSLEWLEMSRWRNAMLDPNCTFYDLLKISAESPAMIIYLDTVASKGNGNNVANENYARELLELFTFGVDNGYDQNDIVQMSRAWTGWSVELVDTANANNPFATASLTLYPGTNGTIKANTIGTWAMNFKSGSYGTNRAPIFPGKIVPARFGPPWAGANYQLTLPPRTGTNGIQDGYDVVTHLANQPFTQEYLSVKLCRLFVHDDFPNPTTNPDLPEYSFYDYTNPDRSAEAELVHQCMMAWENSYPKGNIRAVLGVIFNSDLFHSHAVAAQKVKTPFEFVASSVRALRSSTNGGTGITATTDGASFATPLTRMGGMNLFDRDAPDGYPEFAPNWISSGTLVERIRYIQAFCNAGTGDDAGNNQCDPVGLLKSRLSSGTSGGYNDAGAVTDFFLSILLPGEGAANLALYRQAGINFLNTDDDGVTSSPFAQLSTNYDTRVRGLVSMLMTSPRFQEQ
ncbi:MAG: DUF1800 family protein [Verrucomicrobia bacterium]|nr:DUF1800 family protein [Verrucomicrobiota bacterium]